MDRRTFVCALAGAVLAKSFPADAQSSAIPRIGIFGSRITGSFGFFADR